MDKMVFTVLDSEDGMELKNWFRLKGISTRSVTRLKYYGSILLNGENVTVREKITRGDIIELQFADDEKPATPEDLPLSVLYEDSSVLVLDKPPQMPTHPSKKLQSGTLANAFAFYMENKGKPHSFRPINRLDRGTSGLIVAALDPVSAGKLSGKVDKRYICVCKGKIAENGTIDAPIALEKDSKIKRCVSPDGQRAVTHFKRLFTNELVSVAEVWLETGRTHQIRVHFANMGNALIGDTLYGKADEIIDRQALHCISVSFIHPITNQQISVKGELPSDIIHLLKENNATDLLTLLK